MFNNNYRNHYNNYMGYRQQKDRKYRSEINIIEDILSVFKKTQGKPVGKTRIMYAANLNTRMLSIYLEKLVRQGLLREEERNGRKYYTITPKGMLALLFISRLNILLEYSSEPTDELVSQVHESIKKTIKNYGFKTSVIRDFNLTGSTGLLHRFDFLVKIKDENIGIYVSTSSEDVQQLEYLWLLLGLLDSNINIGLYIRLGRTLSIEKKDYSNVQMYRVEIPENNISILNRVLSQVFENIIETKNS